MEQVRGTVNRVELIGWLGGDPELRLTPNGSKVCRFSVATKRPAGRDEVGKREYATDWTSVEVWERLAELCNDTLHKGSRVLVSGGLRTDNWHDRETGQRRSRTFVRAETVLFLDTRQEPSEEAEAAGEQGEDVPF